MSFLPRLDHDGLHDVLRIVCADHPPCIRKQERPESTLALLQRLLVAGRKSLLDGVIS
jgi:hypothetical protein